MTIENTLQFLIQLVLIDHHFIDSLVDFSNADSLCLLFTIRLHLLTAGRRHLLPLGQRNVLRAGIEAIVLNVERRCALELYSLCNSIIYIFVHHIILKMKYILIIGDLNVDKSASFMRYFIVLACYVHLTGQFIII